MYHLLQKPPGRQPIAAASEPPSGQELCPKEDDERESLAANLVRRCWLDELDELEGLGLVVGVAVDLA